MANLHTSIPALTTGWEHVLFGDILLVPDAFEVPEQNMPDTDWPLTKNRRRANRKAADELHSGKKNIRAQLRVTRWRTRAVNEGKPEQGHHLRLTPEVVSRGLVEAHDPFFDAYDTDDGLEQLDLGGGPVSFSGLDVRR